MSDSPASAPGHVHRKIVIRHAEDAAFYWARRMEGSLASQHYLRSLARFEGLLQAHLEGLRMAQAESSCVDANGNLLQPGAAGWNASFERVQRWKTADETFVAATLALEQAAAGVPGAPEGGSAPLAQLETMACAPVAAGPGNSSTPPMARGLASAAAWLPWDVSGASVRAWAGSPQPVLRRCALSAMALHRLPAGDTLARWMHDPDAAVRTRAVQAVGELGGIEQADAVIAVLDAPASDHGTAGHAAAVGALCLLGHPRGAEFGARHFGAAGTASESFTPLAAWAQVAPLAQIQAFVDAALRQPERRRAALVAMRFSGYVAWLEPLIELMEHECSAARLTAFFAEPATNLARQAADVFAHISGARIGQQLFRAAPEPADDEEVAASDLRIPASRKQDPDEGLLWPDIGSLKRWWSAHGGDRVGAAGREVRWLNGKPLSAGASAAVLVDPVATQLQRHHAALHLRCRRETAQLFDVRAPLTTQQARAQALGLVMP